MKETDLKSISPDESEPDSFLETLAGDTYTRSQDRRASVMVSSGQEGGREGERIEQVTNFLKGSSRVAE